MIRKKFVNKVDSAVDDALRGLVLSNSKLVFHPHNNRIILRRDLNDLHTRGRVTIASAGGSGQEPYTSGLVGINGVSAAICGEIYTSPPLSHIFDALWSIYSPNGTLLFCNNYTDRLNCKMAVERFKAKVGSSAKIGLVYVNDDIGLENRELVGGILVMHVICVMAELKHYQFEVICEQSQKMINNLGSLAILLYPCSLPGRDYLFKMPDDELEVGMGIYGEHEIERQKMGNAKEIIEQVMERLINSKRLNLTNDRTIPIVVLLNNLGSTSQLELRIIQGEILTWLIQRDYIVLRIYIGSVATSLDTHGISITLLKIVDNHWLELLDTHGQISSLWQTTIPSRKLIVSPVSTIRQIHVSIEDIGVQVSIVLADIIRNALLASCYALLENVDLLNRLDSIKRNGNCGISFRNAANAIIDFVNNNKLNFARPAALCLEISDLFEQCFGGNIGVLYAIFFRSCANAFHDNFDENRIRLAIRKGLASIEHFECVKADPGTIVALKVVADADSTQKWSDIVKSVEEAVENTACSGRTKNLVDPDSKAVAIWIRAAYEAIVKRLQADK